MQQLLFKLPSSVFFSWPLVMAAFFLSAAPALAWQQVSLPDASANSQTMHYGGDRTSLETSSGLLLSARVSALGTAVWQSSDAGIHWSSSPLSDATAEQVRLLSPAMAISWARYREPVIHLQSGGLWLPQQAGNAWPLARNWVLDAAVASGDILMLSTDAIAGKIIEGPLYAVSLVSSQWQAPVLLSSAAVGDARLVQHASGLWSAVWSERVTGNGAVSTWRIMLANSSDGGRSWGVPIELVNNILAPEAQEAAVSVAAAALAGTPEQIALVFTGWLNQPYSQVWAKQVDASTGTGSGLTLMPDAGDMVYSPSIAVQSDGRWDVVWQQKIGIDMEIYLAERSAGGLWGAAVNVSSDPLHLDYDAHVRSGISHSLQVAFTRVDVPGQKELYQLSFGSASDPALDSDGDGVPDSQEAGQDLNADGVDDALSAKVATWVHPDGRYALIVEGDGILSQVQSLDTASAHVSDPSQYQALTDMISFKVQGLVAGTETQLYLRTPHAVPADATWMKWNSAGSWQDAGVPIWLAADGKGLHLILTDGGAGDEDGLDNGIISDPGILASPTSTVPATVAPVGPAAAGGGGGCLIVAAGNPLTLTLMLMWMGGLLGLAVRHGSR